MQNPLAPSQYTIKKPSTKNVSAAIPGPGKVSQNELVVSCQLHSGASWPTHHRLSVGHTNMTNATANGTVHSSRERTGRGFRPIFFSSHAHRSWYATTWQAQPQKKRPSTSVSRISAPNSKKPALM